MPSIRYTKLTLAIALDTFPDKVLVAVFAVG